MLLKFVSTITNQGQDNKIEFTTPVSISDWNGFKVFEFKEPKIKEQNRIEVSAERINIFSGANTLNLALGEKIMIEYLVQGGQQVFFQSQLHNVQINDHQIDFSYSLHNQDHLIGEYAISLTIINQT